MLWNLDLSWLMMAVALVTMLSYPFGLALHGVMGSDGFGPLAAQALDEDAQDEVGRHGGLPRAGCAVQ